MLPTTSSSNEISLSEEISQLRAQVDTLEELLHLYEESATEQAQHLQQTLQTSEARAQQLEHAQTTLQTLQTILDSMGDAVIVINKDGRALFINPAAKQLLQNESFDPSASHWPSAHKIFSTDGINPCRLQDHPLSKAIQGESTDAAELQLLQPTQGKNAQPLSKHGQWLSVNARPLVVEEQVTGAVAVFRNIDRQKQAARSLQKSSEAAQTQAALLKKTLEKLKATQATLVQTEKMSSLGKTVAGVAHEINNPVSFIHGNVKHATYAFQNLITIVSLFQKAYPEPPTEIALAIEEADLAFIATDLPKMLNSMSSGTTRIQEIVASLRTFSRLDEADWKSVDIHQGLESALMVLRLRIDNTELTLPIEISRCYGSLPLVECHASQLNQALVNILANAIDSFDKQSDSPKITIQTEQLAETVVIKITDNGAGIPIQTQSSIFDPFFTTKPVGQGVGLGLFVCHQIIVEKHGGSLTCFSEAGKGSEFVIQLPISR